MTGFFFREEPDPDFPDNPEKMVKVEVSNDVVNAAVVALLEEYKASDLPEADRPGKISNTCVSTPQCARRRTGLRATIRPGYIHTVSKD